jgi:hypothetical protein
MPPISSPGAKCNIWLFGLLAVLLLGSTAAATDEPASGERTGPVPPEMVGAWCPTGGCETRSPGLGHSAGFAAALGALLLLAPRRSRAARVPPL